MLNTDRIVSKTSLTEHLYAQDFDRDSNVIEVFVGRLRKKTELNEIDPYGTWSGIFDQRKHSARQMPDSSSAA